jgi:hypothetical protein
VFTGVLTALATVAVHPVLKAAQSASAPLPVEATPAEFVFPMFATRHAGVSSAVYVSTHVAVAPPILKKHGVPKALLK